jgi:hypothetical protein
MSEYLGTRRTGLIKCGITLRGDHHDFSILSSRICPQMRNLSMGPSCTALSRRLILRPT